MAGNVVHETLSIRLEKLSVPCTKQDVTYIGITF